MLLKQVLPSIDPEFPRSPDAFCPVFLRGSPGAGLSGPDSLPSIFILIAQHLPASQWQRLLPAARIPLIPGRNQGSAWRPAFHGCMCVHGISAEGEAQ